MFGLCVLGGALLIVDLRMFGVGLKKQGIAELATKARPWLIRPAPHPRPSSGSISLPDSIPPIRSPSPTNWLDGLAGPNTIITDE